MRSLSGVLATAAIVVAGFAGNVSVASADVPPPPPPVAANGNEVEVFATGVSVPTQIAFHEKTMFIAGAAEGPYEGGLFYVKPGSNVATKVPGTAPSAYGVAWRGSSLFVNFGTRIRVLSGWTGKRFKSARTLASFSPKRFNGFTGLAFGPDGRLYTGVTLQFDHKASKRHYSNSVISLNPRSGAIKTVSTGLRQPWMLTFVKGIRSPFVSVLGQDLPKGTRAPDLIVKATQGSDFGFPSCNWSNFERCGKRFTKPVLALDPAGVAPSPMGMAAQGRKLFVALFNGMSTKQGPVGPEVITTNVKGTRIRDFVTGLAPVLSVAVRGDFLYIGDFSGTIYRVQIS